ncbi:MAG: PAS domain S-box protein [Desulfobulbaceae bacterium]|nr:PAS domain S-box protein [Desulfobulbaceae bacterium]
MISLRLRTHLIFYLSTITFLLSLAIISLNTMRFKEHLIHNLADQGKTLAYHIAISVADDIISENYSPLQDFVREFTTQTDVIGIEIADANENILATNDLTKLGSPIKRYPTDTPPHQKDKTRLYKDNTNRILIVTTPIKVHNITIGKARVIMSTEEIMAQLSDVQYKSMLTGAFFWLISIGLGIFIARIFTKPMYGLMRATNNISEGNFKEDIPKSHTISELNNFSKALKVMRNTIATREEDLRESERKFRHLFERAMEGIFVCTISGKLEEINPAMISLLRASSKGDVLEKNVFTDLFQDRENVTALLQHIVRHNFVQNREIQLTRLDGSLIEVSLSCHAVRGAEGNVEKLEGLMRDITIQKRASMEISRMRNLLNNIYESMPSMLVTLDSEGIVTQWNTAAHKITDITPLKAIGKNLWELLPSLRKYQKQYDHTNLKRQSIQLRHEQLSDDDKRLFDVTFFPLLADEGTSGVAIRLDDITELENKEQQLRQAQKMECVGNLAGGLAHDFNNILSTILGNLSLTEFELNTHGHISDKQLRESITNMTTAGYRAADLVRQLLTLSSKQESNLIPVDLNISIKNIKKLSENTFDKSVSFVTFPADTPANVLADPGQVEQVLLNLSINAAHAMTLMRGKKTWGGTLTIELNKVIVDDHFRKTHPEADKPAYWLLSVSDTGVGMKPKTISKIFDPFFSTKKQGRGSGLGLAMAYNIIKQFNGFIDTYSEKGMGTVFNVYLPLLDKPIKIKPKNTLPRIHFGSGLILVVDDDELVRKLSCKIIQTAGYEVLTARDGRDAVEIYRDHRNEIKAVILDMVMPIMSGKEAYLELRQINPDIKVLLTSGFRQDVRVEEILGLGVNAFLKKPFSLKSMTKSLQDLLQP